MLILRRITSVSYTHLDVYKRQVILLSGSRTRAKRLSEDITDQGITCFYTENYDHELSPGSYTHLMPDVVDILEEIQMLSLNI